MTPKKMTLLLLFISVSGLTQENTANEIFNIARNGSLQELKELLAVHPMSIDMPNEAGYNALTLACYNSNNEVAKYIVENTKSINANNGYGTALMAATVKGNVELVEYLVQHNADMDISDANGKTALHYAVVFNSYEIVEFLIKSGAKFDLKDNRGNTAKDYAKLKSNKKILTLFKV
ncbi:ankyrin repeat domain-containing protein [Tenacibaculum sp. 190524A05c]|uniref:ankyrin repeat domain-containing protein n=1 Tax=Tenacibaculum platacis TaxID=3137852 RepID=UPI0031FA830A